ncbi:MAG: DoxX family protein [Burkholderiales bacterium]
MAHPLENLLTRFGPLAARVLLAQVFIVSGIGKLFNFTKMAAFLFNKGLPASEALLILVIVLELGGGLMLVAGLRVRWVAAAFIGFTLLASVLFHPFWAVEADKVTAELNNFMKNLALMGGMLYVMAFGAGPFSLDAMLAKAAPPPR